MVTIKEEIEQKGHKLDKNWVCQLCGVQMRVYTPKGCAGPDNWEWEYTDEAFESCKVCGPAAERTEQ